MKGQETQEGLAEGWRGSGWMNAGTGSRGTLEQKGHSDA